MTKKLSILLIEDNEAESESLKEYSDTKDDVTIVAVTNSTRKGLEYVATLLPDAVILDLEFHEGEGNGISFLNALNEPNFSCRPYVLVTTNNINPVTHAKVRTCGAGFIMTKNQEDYSAGNVIEFLRDIKDFIKNNTHGTKLHPKMSTIETPEDFSKRVSRLINRDLDLLGFSPMMKGRNYLKEGIQILIQDEPNGSIRALVAKKFDKTSASVDRAMQNAINKTWRTIPIEDLNKYYTAYINPKRGFPTCSEFLSHFAEKIKSEL